MVTFHTSTFGTRNSGKCINHIKNQLTKYFKNLEIYSFLFKEFTTKRYIYNN